MNENLTAKIKESAHSVLPISAIVLGVHLAVVPIPPGTLALFAAGTLLLVVGMGIFTLGSEMAMMPIGEIMGSRLTASRNLPLLIVGSFLLGVIVTVAEPDLQVLTKQVPSVPDNVLVASVAVGVGFFLVLAILRIIFQVRLARLFLASYAAVFLAALLTAPDYLAVGFDSGGVTTGPITVPFILAIGVGVSGVAKGRAQNARPEDDSFGLCAVCSIGPILTVLVMGMFYDSSEAGYAFETASSAESFGNLLELFANGFLIFTKDVLTAIAFDSGGVASGTMAAAFLLPFAVGVSDAVGGNMMTDAFGIVAMVAMMPLVSIQVLGLMYRMKMRRIERGKGGPQ